MTETRDLASGRGRRWRRPFRSRGLQLLVGFIALGFVVGRGLERAGGPAAVGERMGTVGIALLVPAQALVAFTPFFGEMVALANGALYGFWIGTAMNFAAWMGTALLQYALFRRTAHDFDFDATYARLPAWLRRLPVSHPVFLIGVRIPLGGPIVNAAAAAFGVAPWRHTWCAAVGNAPRAAFFAALGAGLLR